ncbi:MAG: MoaD/ThiS family protein [Candidatus Porifericomitaceae bacterium WSBS_2022_MAG_OTU9]
MKNIRFKLYAGLMDYLPPSAVDNAIQLQVGDDASPSSVLDAHQVPKKLAHLVLINGVYINPSDRDSPLDDGDTLAVWPPVAGG